MKRNTFFKNAVIVSAGSFFAKALGAGYRIPLANLLGGYGAGLYQMAYPLFCVLLTFSSAGIPNAFARIVSRERAEGKESFFTVRSSLKLFCAVGLCAALLMCLLAPVMARVQGELALVNCYYALAPAVLLVAMIAVLRGYFQGNRNMKPTALSEVLEQIVKMGFGLAFALAFRDDVVKATVGALFAVTLSELVALAWLLFVYRGEGSRLLPNARRVAPAVFSVAFPAMASSALLPLSQTVDSVMIVRLLSRYTARAVPLYVLFAGSALALVNLPVGLAYGFAVASVPSISEACASGKVEEGKRRAISALTLTLLVALPCALVLYFGAKPIVALLYSSLGAGEQADLVNLVKISAFSTVSLAGVQTLSACLVGMGRASKSALSMLVAVGVKFVAQYLLVSNPFFSVLGAAIASDACYLVAFSLNLVYTLSKEKRRETDNDNRRKLGGRRRGLERARARGDFSRGQGARSYGADRFGEGVEKSGRSLRIARLRLRKEP